MDKNNLGIIKDMAKLFSATILSGLFFTGCVDMDLTPKNQPSEGEVWVGEKFQSNPEIAGSPRNSFRASLDTDLRR